MPLLLSMKRGEVTVRGGQAASSIRSVHDVVVDEGTGLEELQAAGCLEDSLIRRGFGRAAAPAPVTERRAEALSAREQSRERVSQWCEVVAERGQERSLIDEHAIHNGLDPGAEIRNVQGITDRCRIAHGVSLRGAIRRCRRSVSP